MQIVGLHRARMQDADKHARLREARAKRYATAKEAAAALGVPYGTYSGHEKGSRGFSNEEGARYAKFLRVRVEWLIFGVGPSAEGRVIPLGGYIGAGGAIDTSTEQSDPSTEYEVELMATIPDAAIAYQVVGTSMLPVYQPDTVIVCGDYVTDPKDLMGEEVAVGTAAGERYLKIIHPGSQPGLYHLSSHNAPLMMDVELRWVAEVVAIIPAKKFKRLEKAARTGALRANAA